MGVSNYVVQRHRMGREDAARRRAEERELRRAARIVLEELHLLERLLKRVAQPGGSWPTEPVSNQAWGRYQDALAADVTDETWRYLATAYDGIRQFNEAAAHGRALTKGVGVNFSSAGLREGFVNVHQAMTCLERDLPGSKAGIHHYTGYASADDMWPVGSLPS